MKIVGYDDELELVYQLLFKHLVKEYVSEAKFEDESFSIEEIEKEVKEELNESIWVDEFWEGGYHNEEGKLCWREGREIKWTDTSNLNELKYDYLPLEDE